MSGILPIAALLALLALGILYCFWGYKYLKITMLLYAFCMGAYYSYQFLGTYMAGSQWIWLIALVIGLVCALLAFFFVKFALFVAGGMVGLLVFDLLKSSTTLLAGMDNVPLFFVGLGLFIVFGIITLASRRHFVILFSGVLGSYTMIRAIGVVIGLFFNISALDGVSLGNIRETFDSISVFHGQPIWVFAVPVCAFAIAGIITQYKFTAPAKRKGKREA